MTDIVGRYDDRNKLNDLTGKEWLKSTKSFFLSKKCIDDKPAFNHPAPFLIKDIERMISLFTKERMTVLDPFMGSGTTTLASYNLNRKSIGIDLSKEYKQLALKRFKQKGIIGSKDFKYIVGDSLKEIPKLNAVDYIITSPPYHNILKNNSNGLRKDSSVKGYRSGSRIGVKYYSDKQNDLGNQKSYNDFLLLFQKIMEQAFNKLRSNKYCSIVISNFTVDKKEICVQADVIKLLCDIGFEFVGTIILLQDNKPLYPFGYPYSFKINHMHQNIINFKKTEK
ncbi:DNA methyltransferase [Candidatus Endomicrobiellum agilis]|uniref:DNA methyltransferase n=1 Tax=Candidatus Endomicrobiellum agilis TaxID=3238957 RepID=UPI003582AF59|nr:site-specific DNA-methyltransferase [Endomicrobium sp.]